MLSNIGSAALHEKERARAEAMRQRNAERLARFQNARARTIGVDSKALDQQRAEHAAQAQLEAEAAQAEHERQLEIAALVDAREREEHELRRREMEALRLEWREQTLQARAARQNERADFLSAVDSDRCGPSAVQCFRGEDRDRAARVEAQRAQVRRWTAQRAVESAAQNAAARQEQARHDNVLKAATEAAAAAEAEDQAARAALTGAVKAQNRRLAGEKGARLEQWRAAQLVADAAEIEFRERMLAEDDDTAKAAFAGRRILHDRFKGLSERERRALLAGNERLAAERAAARRQEADETAEDVRRQEALLRAVDAQEREHAAVRRALEAARQNELQRQRDELQYKKLLGRHERFGAIAPEGGFYGGFGQSCR